MAEKKKQPKTACQILDSDTENRVSGLSTVIAKLEGARSILNGSLQDLVTYSIYDDDIHDPIQTMCENLSLLEVLVATKITVIGSIRKVKE